MSEVPNNNSIQVNDSGPTIPGPYLSPQQTETWPLQPGRETFWTKYCNAEGSLKSVIFFLFGTAGAVTIALLAHLNNISRIDSGGAVISDNPICTEIGQAALRQGGHAVDAAVAALFCLGVVHFHVTGIGGGGVMMGYNERSREVFDVIDFQVSAPATMSDVPVGVPGFVAGLWEAHQKHGLLPWSNLVSPSVKLARNGFPVSSSLLSAASCITLTPSNKALNDLKLSLKPGLNITLPQLADTLEVIARTGKRDIYNGSIGDEIFYTVLVAKGNLTKTDLMNYRVNFDASETIRFQDFDVTVPSSSFAAEFLVKSLQQLEVVNTLNTPGSVPEAIQMRRLLDLLQISLQNLTASETGRRPSGEGKHSTVLTIADSNHNLLSVVTGLNSLFGSQLMTEGGFLLNDFVRNGVVRSVGVPVLATQASQRCGLRILTGGSEVTTLVQVLDKMITYNQPGNESVEAARFHLGPMPRSILLEALRVPELSEATLASLRKMQVSVFEVAKSTGCLWYDSVNILAMLGDTSLLYADSRSNGLAGATS